MKVFPDKLNIINKDKFKNFNYNRNLCYLRQELYEHIIKENENNYFELDNFSKKYNINLEDISKMKVTIIKELEDLGWKCKMGFGETGLFIYSTKELPSSCYQEEF